MSLRYTSRRRRVSQLQRYWLQAKSLFLKPIFWNFWWMRQIFYVRNFVSKTFVVYCRLRGSNSQLNGTVISVLYANSRLLIEPLLTSRLKSWKTILFFHIYLGLLHANILTAVCLRNCKLSNKPAHRQSTLVAAHSWSRCSWPFLPRPTGNMWSGP